MALLSMCRPPFLAFHHDFLAIIVPTQQPPNWIFDLEVSPIFLPQSQSPVFAHDQQTPALSTNTSRQRRRLQFDPPPPPLSTTTYITLVGDANTSLDVARLLLSDADKPSPLDIPVDVIDRLKSSSIRHIDIVSRHGPSQVSFKSKGFANCLIYLRPRSTPSLPRSFSPGPSADISQTPEFSPFFSEGPKDSPRSTPKTFPIRFLR
ncbi:hypothetical protein BS47DRAFT_1488172 [Hydnum rufescens UP504]|uniref:Uncharacterized protein n=1 Tax=Hydnum rufescens UP504 TaxID=1448309 RepID=A0A9P6ANZ9_9AGAM|nr:hypothetical protein BS47DRAFT_1488172 [Hydnum rufescens UP504]